MHLSPTQWFGVVSKPEDWGLEEGLFQQVESLLGLSGQGHFVGLQLEGVTLEMVVQRSFQVSEMHNEASEVSDHLHEPLDGCIGVRFREGDDSFYMFLARLVMRCVRYVISSQNRLHLEGLSFKCSAQNLSNMILM